LSQIDLVRNVTDPDNLYVVSLGDEIAVKIGRAHV
jgi:hypothetical protein